MATISEPELWLEKPLGKGIIRGANDASRARVQISLTRTRKLESELDSNSKARKLEK